MYQFQVGLAGLSPMLMAQLDPFAMLAAPKGGPTKTTSAFEGDPNEWKRLCYWKEGVGLFLRSDCLETCVAKACASGRFRAGKTGATQYVKSGFLVDGIENKLVLDSPSTELKKLDKKGPGAFSDTKTITDVPPFVDVRVIMIKATKGRQCRYRVMIPEGWKCQINGEMLNEEVDPKKLESIIAYAGQLQGLLDYRPKYGRFSVTSFTTM